MHICERSPDGTKPVNCIRAVFGKRAHQIEIRQIMSQAISIRNEVFNSAVVQTELGFQLGSGCIHTALGSVAVAAHHWHLLQDENIRSFLIGTDSRSQAGAASADNHHVIIQCDVFLFNRLRRSRFLLKGGSIESCLCEGFCHSSLDRRAGNGRAGNTVNQDAVCLDNRTGQLFYRY